MVKGLGVLTETEVTEVNVTETRWVGYQSIFFLLPQFIREYLKYQSI